jgi:hypothetical protein
MATWTVGDVKVLLACKAYHCPQSDQNKWFIGLSRCQRVRLDILRAGNYVSHTRTPTDGSHQRMWRVHCCACSFGMRWCARRREEAVEQSQAMKVSIRVCVGGPIPPFRNVRSWM